jgi:hypothetical protein
MANDLFREMVEIARDYFHPFLAETMIRSWCERCGTNDDEVCTLHLPSIILIIATDDNIYKKLKFHQYLDFMKRFIAFSNRFEDKDPERSRKFIEECKSQVHN